MLAEKSLKRGIQIARSGVEGRIQFRSRILSISSNNDLDRLQVGLCGTVQMCYYLEALNDNRLMFMHPLSNSLLMQMIWQKVSGACSSR